MIPGFATYIGSFACEYLLDKILGGLFDTSLKSILGALSKKAFSDAIKEEIDKAVMNTELDGVTLEIFDNEKEDFNGIRRGFYNQIFRVYEGKENPWYVTSPPCNEDDEEKIGRQLFDLVSNIRDRMWNNKSLKDIFLKKDFKERVMIDLVEIEEEIQVLREKIEAHDIKIAEHDQLIAVHDQKISELEKNANKLCVSEYYSDHVRSFVGRDKELCQISEALKNDNLVFVNGFGGIGKSELCRRYIKEFKKEEGAKAVWLTYEKDIKYTIAAGLRVSGFDSSKYEGDIDGLYEAKMNILSAEDNLLIIVDNYEWGNNDLADIKKCRHKVLITTRYEKIPKQKYRVVHVDKLSEEEAFDLLRGGTDGRDRWIEANRKALSELFVRLRYHTLTIVLLGGLIDEKSVDGSSLADNIFTISDEEVYSGKDDGDVFASIKKHIELLLSSYNFSQEEKDILSVASLIPISGIGLEIFKIISTVPEDALKRLFSLNVLNKSEIDGEDYISMHPLISEYIWNDRPPSSLDDESKYSLKYMVNFNKVLEYLYVMLNKKELYGIINELKPLEALYRIEIDKGRYNAKIVTDFLESVAFVYTESSMIEEATEICDILASIADSDMVRIKSYRSYVKLYRTSGNYLGVVEYCQKVLDLKEKGMEIEDDDHDLYYLIAEAYANAKEREKSIANALKAEELMEKKYGDKEDIPDEDLTDISMIYGLLRSLYRLKMDFEKSDEYTGKINKLEKKQLEKLISIAEPEDSEAVEFANKLNMINFGILESMDEESAIELVEYLTDKMRKYVIPEMRPGLFKRFYQYFMMKGNYDKASEIAQMFLDMVTATVNENHVDLIEPNVLLAQIKLAVKDYPGAIDHYKTVLDIIEVKKIENYPLNSIYTAMATAYYMMNMWDECQECCHKAIECYETNPNDNSALVTAAYELLCVHHYENGELDIARKYYGEASSVAKADLSLCVDPPLDLDLYMAISYSVSGRFKEALEIIDTKIDIDAVSDPDIQFSLYGFKASVNAAIGDFETAKEIFRNAEILTDKARSGLIEMMEEVEEEAKEEGYDSKKLILTFIRELYEDMNGGELPKNPVFI